MEIPACPFFQPHITICHVAGLAGFMILAADDQEVAGADDADVVIGAVHILQQKTPDSCPLQPRTPQRRCGLFGLDFHPVMTGYWLQ
jgi:hypothetical protein